ncbi:MAG: carotenoid biosynthesis protein [Acidobacteriaceae bacterium]
MHDRTTRNFLVALLLTYAVARVLQIFPTRVPTLLIVVLHVLPPAAFALLHGRRLFGTRGILAFSFFCLASAIFFESLGLRTGFPYGHYTFTAVMGPKILQLPILLALAYLGVGYCAWMIASLIVRPTPRSRTALWLVPILASVVMSAWDFAMDPVWVNIDRAWIWFQGGAWFGVPLTNFAGWLLTNWIGYQAFALWLHRRPTSTPAAPSGWNRLAILMYAVTAAGNLLLAVPSAVPAFIPATITDAAGRHWSTPSVIHASILVSLLIMMPFALVAWIRSPRYPCPRRSESAGASQLSPRVPA